MINLNDYSKEELIKIIESIIEEKKILDLSINSQLDTLFVFNPETGKPILWNKAFCNISGYSDEEIAELKAPDSYYSDEDIKKATAFIKEIEKTLSGTIELSLICKNGNKIVTEYKVSTINNAEGKSKYFISIGRDISERKIFEQALKESEFKLRERVKELQGLYSLGLLTEKYNKLDDIFDEFVNTVVSESMQFPDKVIAYLAIENKVYCNVENFKLPKDKKCLSAKVIVFEKQIGTLTITYTEDLPFIEKFEQELINGYAGRISKITERIKAVEQAEKNAEEYRNALKQSNQFLEILDSLPSHVYIKNNQRQYTYANKICLELFKKTRETIYGSVDEEFFPPITLKQLAKIDKQILEEGKTTKEEVLVTDDNGNSITYLEMKFPLYNEKGEINGLCGISTDISEIKGTQKKLKEANAAKDKFFSIIAHDLKGPLSSILSFSNKINENFDKYDVIKLKEYFRVINKGINNIYRLLENLLLWSLAQKDNIDFIPTKINLNLSSNETCELLSQSAENKSIKIINEIPGDIYVYADKEMLSTVFRNLISNAIKYTPRKGVIKIKAHYIIHINNQEFVEISVEDTGIGISKEIQSKLFDISESTSTIGTDDETGTGLGLVLCKEFIRKHKGKIWVESEVEKGSDFKFTIPSYNKQKDGYTAYD